MTDQQKKAVEEAIKARENTIIRRSFRLGAEEVLNNPEKYDLYSISDLRKAWHDGWTQNTNERYDDSNTDFAAFMAKLKGGGTCKP